MDWKCWLKKFPLLVLTTFWLFSLVQGSLDISKREAQIIRIIEEQAVNLDSRKFLYDPIMVQGDSHSVYTDPKKKPGQDIIFRKPNSDNGKEAIALSSVENKWAIPTPRGSKKRQFVLLRRSPNGVIVGTPGSEKVPYFASFVYVTNFLPNLTSDEAKTFDVAGVKSVVEWDVWETRPKMGSFYAGWDTCDYTLLFTCESLQDMMMTASEELDKEKNNPQTKKPKRKKRDVALMNKTTNQTFPPPRSGPLTPIKSEPGYDASEYNDLYLDLDIYQPVPNQPKKPKKHPSHAHLHKGKSNAQVAKSDENKRVKRKIVPKTKPAGRSMDAEGGGEVAAEGGASAGKSGRGMNKLNKGSNLFKSILGGKKGGGLGGLAGGLLKGAANVAGGVVSGAAGLAAGAAGVAAAGVGAAAAGVVGAGAAVLGTAGGIVDAAAGLAGDLTGGVLNTLSGGLLGDGDPLSLFADLGVDGVLGGLADVSLGAGLGLGGEAGPLGLLNGLGEGLGGLLGGEGGLEAGLGITANLGGLLGDGVGAGLGIGANLNLGGLLGDGVGAGLGIGANLNLGALLGGDGEGADAGALLSAGLNLGASVGAAGEDGVSAGLGVGASLGLGGLLGGDGEGGVGAGLGVGASVGGLLGGDGVGSVLNVGASVGVGADLLGSLSGILGADVYAQLETSLGEEGLANVTGVMGADGLANLCGMVGADGVAQLQAKVGIDGMAQLGGLFKAGLPVAALVGLFGGDGNALASVSASAGVGANAAGRKLSEAGGGGEAEGEGEAGAEAGAEAEAEAGGEARRKRNVGKSQDDGDAGKGGKAKAGAGASTKAKNEKGLDVGKVLNGKKGGVLTSLSSGLVGSAGEVISGPVATAIGATLDTLVGGGLGDVELPSIAGVIAGITEGDLGASSVLGTLLAGGLGTGGSINSLLEGNLLDVVTKKVTLLADGMAGSILNFFSLSGDAGVSGSVGGVLSNILKGNDAVAGRAGPLSMATSILGPIASALDPINAVAAAALSIGQNLPVLAKGLGQNIIKQLPNVVESMGLGGLVQAMGIGPIIGSVYGLADAVITAGEALLSAVDILGNGLIDGIADVLVDMGIPREFATLAATGTKLVWCGELMKYKAGALGIRLGADLIGSQVNSGRFRGAGAGPATGNELQNWQAMMNGEGEPSNALTVYGFTFPGASEDKDFFYPDSAYVKSIFKPTDTNKAPITGYHLPGVEPGAFDLFYPDEPSALEEYVGQYGVMTPESYKQPHRDANHGVRGKMGKHGQFIPDSPAKFAVVHVDHPDTEDKFWMPAEVKTKFSLRPTTNQKKTPLIYGFLFHGIRESPHVFIAEGDILTGFFVPDDPNYPEIQDTPHGMFIPDSIAGHGRFVLEDKTEFSNVKEVRGAFFPDAGNLAMAIGGRLSKSRTEQGVYNFVMDRLAVEFVYVKGHSGMKAIWASFLSKEEWNYVPPAIPPPDNKKEGNGQATAAHKGKVRDHFGVRIQSQRTEAFFPKDFEVEGLFIPSDKDKSKGKPFSGTLTAGKTNAPWKFKVTSKQPDHTPLEGEVKCLFVPTDYPEDDALSATVTLDAGNDNGEIKFGPKQKQTEYFYEKGDDIWVPPHFLEMVNKGESEPVKKEKSKSDPKESSVPGVITKTQPPPDRMKNYYFGPWHDSNSEDYKDASLQFLPHVYQYGYYYYDPESPGPLFIPEVGALGTFTPDDNGAKPVEGYFFPAKLEAGSEPAFVPKDGGSAPAGTAGKFYTSLMDTQGKGEKQTKEYFRCTFKDPANLEKNEKVEIIPGWELADTIIPKKEDGTFDEARITPTRGPAKYRLINIGGGFKGVVVNGPADLDNPNNPIFQRFLHYKANRDGDVNPWGNVIILDPIIREASAKPESLGVGTLEPVVKSAPTVSKKLLEKFSLINWEWPLSKEGTPGWKPGERVSLGSMTNIANMMDFRMWLLTKYDCKYFKNGDKESKVLTPKSGDAFLDDLVPAAPKPEWIQKLSEGKTQLYVTKTEGLLPAYAQTFNIKIEQLQPFVLNSGNVDLKKLGTDVKIPEMLKTAKFDEWGDKFSCELIEVDDLTLSQATEEQPMNGVDLGIQLTSNVGSAMSYPPLASKLLKKINEKKSTPPGAALDGMGATDLNGKVKLKTKQIMQEKKEANINDSGEVDSAGGQTRRKKRDATPALERKTAKNIPGWKTQFRSPLTDNKTLSDEGVIFYGLGNCKQESPPPLELHQSKNPNKLLEYFMKVLRIDCMHQAKDQITDLFNEDYIALSETEEYFDLSKTNHRVNEARLLPSEIRKLSIAFEFTAFSKIYHTLRSKGSPTKGYIEEPNCVITRSVSFLTELTLYYIMRGRKVMPAHNVRLTRNLLKTLRTVMTKLHQDTLALHEECPDKCDLDKRLTNGDKFRVMSLIQFIIHGMGPYNKGEKLKPSFYTFVSDNTVAIRERVDEFARQYNAKNKVGGKGGDGLMKVLKKIDKERRRKRRSIARGGSKRA